MGRKTKKKNKLSTLNRLKVLKQQAKMMRTRRWKNKDSTLATNSTSDNQDVDISEPNCDQANISSYLDLDSSTLHSAEKITLATNSTSDNQDIDISEPNCDQANISSYLDLDSSTLHFAEKIQSKHIRTTAKKRKHVDEQLPYEIISDNRDDEDGNTIAGHRIIDVKGFMEEMQIIAAHESLFNCGLSSLSIISEKRKGLHSIFELRCQMCRKTFTIKNTSEDLNKSAVSGVMSAGCGNAQMNQFLAAMNLPNVSEHTYNRLQDEVCNEWELTAWEEMKKAGEREREAALKEGRVSKNGVPLIDVVLDGCWSKRSYRTNYSALSGAAAIIGRRFGQVLFLSVKNKYCCFCARAENKTETVKEHACYKNFWGPSTAMEASIIVEGFKQSIEMHGVIYSRFIADGDSNTYAKILESRPYSDITVEKINCKNHILRNFCNKLQQLKTDTKYRVDERKLLTNEKILSSRKYIINSIKLHSTSNNTDKLKSLHKDITICLRHGFGFHRECNKEICSRETELSNHNFFNTQLWQRMKFITTNVASHSRSLIENVDSNIVECFNSVIAKFIGGKRVNYGLRRSYQARCAGALISFNTGKILTTVHNNIYNKPPREQVIKYETKKQKKRELNRNRGRKIKRTYQKTKTKEDSNYGENADAPDLDPVTFEEKKDTFLKSLALSDEQRIAIEKRTMLQSQSGEWMELRRNMITASNFGKVIKRNQNKSCQNIVKSLLYKANIDHVASIAHGKNNEQIALDQLATMLNVEIEKCGLFIDKDQPFLGATPDGVINNEKYNMLVEIKCPIVPFKIGIDAAIEQGKMHFWRVKKGSREVFINTRSDWHFQAQAQMHIAQKDKCLLAVWYGDNKIKTEILTKDDHFWHTQMEPKLVKFYYDCLLPELVDPRFTRGRPIRNPPYVKDDKGKENLNK